MILLINQLILIHNYHCNPISFHSMDIHKLAEEGRLNELEEHLFSNPKDIHKTEKVYHIYHQYYYSLFINY